MRPASLLTWRDWELLAPALAAGNTVVFKPAETTPVSASLLAEIAGAVLPPGVLNLICGDRDSGRAMVAHEVPGMFSITGTVRSGMEVASSTAADLKRAHLQLGGKAPAVVFDDADVGAAARGIARAAFDDAGQSCTAASRVLAGAGVLKGTIGVFGLLGVLALCAYPFLQLGIQYLLYQLTRFLASVIGSPELCAVIKGLGGAFGLILGMVGSCALVLLISILASAAAVTA